MFAIIESQTSPYFWHLCFFSSFINPSWRTFKKSSFFTVDLIFTTKTAVLITPIFRLTKINACGFEAEKVWGFWEESSRLPHPFSIFDRSNLFITAINSLISHTLYSSIKTMGFLRLPQPSRIIFIIFSCSLLIQVRPRYLLKTIISTF